MSRSEVCLTEALRPVADRLLAVACAMLRNATNFDPERVAKLADVSS